MDYIVAANVALLNVLGVQPIIFSTYLRSVAWEDVQQRFSKILVEKLRVLSYKFSEIDNVLETVFLNLNCIEKSLLLLLIILPQKLCKPPGFGGVVD